MDRTLRRLAGFALAGILLLAGAAPAQVNLLWYKEVAKDGRIYVFNDPNEFKAWEGSGELGKSITKIGFGPNGETVVFDNDTALDLYVFKHGKEPEVRPYAAPKPPKPVPPTTLKIGDGELKLGGLLQGWYVLDDSATGSGSSQLGNSTGVNTFRLRRAEIKLSGKVTPEWGFEVMIDPTKSPSVTAGADGKILQDFAITFGGLKGHDFQLGQKKVWLMEEGTAPPRPSTSRSAPSSPASSPTSASSASSGRPTGAPWSRPACRSPRGRRSTTTTTTTPSTSTRAST